MHQKHGICRIYIQKPMFTNKHNSSIKPPERLFGIIIKRLKIEQKLKILRGKLSVFSVLFVASVIMVAVAIFSLNSELTISEFGPLILLLFSDTLAIFRYYQYFVLAFLESIPVVFVAIPLMLVALLMILLRFMTRYYEKIITLNKLNKVVRKNIWS